MQHCRNLPSVSWRLLFPLVNHLSKTQPAGRGSLDDVHLRSEHLDRAEEGQRIVRASEEPRIYKSQKQTMPIPQKRGNPLVQYFPIDITSISGLPRSRCEFKSEPDLMST
jgi:hypothetical protein